MNRKWVCKFQPLRFRKNAQVENVNELLPKTLSPWQYSSSGKASFYHILKSLGVKNKILIPTYVCSSILVPLRRLNITPIYYDCDDELNPSVTSVSKMFEVEAGVEAILVVSLYGKSADMKSLLELARCHGAYFIDDAAQSFGACFDNLPVGTFGDAGFFSFSPGKPTAGHLGSFFWTRNVSYQFTRRSRPVTHYIVWLNFLSNRYYSYSFHFLKCFRIVFHYLNAFIGKYINMFYDSCALFERGILAGIIESNYANIGKRQNAYKKIAQLFSQSRRYRLSHNDFLSSNPHKIVILCSGMEDKLRFRTWLKSKNIYCGDGYSPVCLNSNTPRASLIWNKVLELPLEVDENRFQYLYDSILCFLQNE